MKVAYIMTAFPPSTGGAQTHLFEIAKRMNRQHQAHAICHWTENRHDWLRGVTVNAPGNQEYLLENLTVSQINLNQQDKRKLAGWSWSYYLTMDWSVDKISNVLCEKLDQRVADTDIVHVGRIGREFIAWAGYKLARKRGVPFVLTPFHHPKWQGYLYHSYLKLYQVADAVMALTEAEKRVLIKLGVSAKRIHVIGHAPVLSASQPQPNYFGPGGPVIMFLGQKYAYKGLKQLVKAMPLVWKVQPEARFAFIGPRTKYSTKLFSRIQDERVIEQDRISEVDKTSALNDCTLFCLPSRQESFGGVYAEAWLYRKPVIGGNSPAIADVIDHGQNGYLVGTSEQELADTIIKLLESNDLQQKMGQHGQLKVNKLFNWETICEKQEKVYQRLLAAKK